MHLIHDLRNDLNTRLLCNLVPSLVRYWSSLICYFWVFKARFTFTNNCQYDYSDVALFTLCEDGFEILREGSKTPTWPNENTKSYMPFVCKPSGPFSRCFLQQLPPQKRDSLYWHSYSEYVPLGTPSGDRSSCLFGLRTLVWEEAFERSTQWQLMAYIPIGHVDPLLPEISLPCLYWQLWISNTWWAPIFPYSWQSTYILLVLQVDRLPTWQPTFANSWAESDLNTSRRF